MSESDSPQRTEEHRKLRLALVDIDGTLIENGAVLPGTLEALEVLRKTVAAVRFVTNDSTKSVVTQIKELKTLGIKILEKEFISALALTKLYLKTHKLRPFLLLSPGALEDFACIDQTRPNCVVVGDQFSQEKLNQAIAVLLQSNAQLIAVDKSQITPTGNMLGAGAYVAALEYASGKHATLIGKPSRTFWNDAVQSAITIHEGRNNITSYEQAVMIGDDVHNDIVGATDSGINGILVQTGAYRPVHDIHCMDPERPRKALGIATNFPRAVSLVKAINDNEED